jgi:hypothetical protein
MVIEANTTTGQIKVAMRGTVSCEISLMGRIYYIAKTINPFCIWKELDVTNEQMFTMQAH